MEGEAGAEHYPGSEEGLMCSEARSVGQRAPRRGWPGNREMSAGRWGHPAAAAPADKEETSSINAPRLRATCATQTVLSRLQTLAADAACGRLSCAQRLLRMGLVPYLPASLHLPRKWPELPALSLFSAVVLKTTMGF